MVRPPKLYCGNLRESWPIAAALAGFAGGDGDEVVVLRGDDFGGDDVAGAELLFVAGDEDEAVHIGSVGGRAADEDVAFAFDGLIEDDVDGTADLLLVAGE